MYECFMRHNRIVSKAHIIYEFIVATFGTNLNVHRLKLSG